MAAFETEQLTVREIFSDDHVFRFPLYQRPYRWEQHHAETFLNDLLTAGEGASRVDEIPPYFIGSIVLVKNGDARKRMVIDGRQRLTTIALLLAVLRDLERKPEHRNELHEMLFDAESEINAIPSGPRLQVEGEDGAGLMRWAIEKGATAHGPEEEDDVSERVERVAEIVRLFRQRVMGLNDEARTRLRDFLVRRCEAVAVVTSDEEQGLRIFQVLNTRGLPLSEVDLIKPDLLATLDAEGQRAALERWDEAESALGSEGMNKLLRALFVIHARRMPSDDPKKFHEEFVLLARQRDVKALTLEQIPAYADLLSLVERGELPCSDLARDPNLLLQGLRWLGWSSEDWLPVALEILMRAGEDEDKAYRWLQGLERVCYAFFILKSNERSSRQARREVFMKALNDLGLERDPVREGGALTLLGEERRRLLETLRRPIEAPYQRRALLQRLEVALSAGRLHPKLNEASLEHVLPYKTRNSEWAKLFPHGAHRECLNLLGNMVLLNKKRNVSIGNKGFAEKKKVIFRNGRQRFFETAKDLRGAEEWTASVIRARTVDMVKVLAGSLGV